MAHTPGPWFVEEIYEGSRTIAAMRDFRRGIRVGMHVNAERDWVGPADVKEIGANARLIAAAPDLLEALNGMVGLIQLIESREPDLKNSHRYIAALAAINKAEAR